MIEEYHMDRLHPRIFVAVMFLGLALLQVTGCASFNNTGLQRDENELEQLRIEAVDARKHLREEMEQHSDSHAQASLAALDAILKYVQGVKADPEKFDPDRIREYNEKIRMVKINIEQLKNNSLRRSITFPEGTYKIAELEAREQGKLRELSEDILRSATDLHRRFPKYPIRITVKVLGFSDEAPIAEGTRLEEAIIENISEPKPPGPARRRQFNRVLSGLRAADTGRFLMEMIPSGLPEEFPVQFSKQIDGMGEKLPQAEAAPPYEPLDSRRRICRITAFVEIVP